ncbi:hypothetical protein SISNIDRAFT_453395 [Sistotremastrum niveocremeum HHB9708]|uniref:Acetyl-CoA synthetase-like protein n=1 Tax=Sistotremastrum niveocremeum HHB9708 TaxID=1314777 RepID=A0A164VU61_9AGAM|nr:hypothetical protein SISNIDRAFT_453395 [Sistotremastrum niveocremeum HHB9708]
MISLKNSHSAIDALVETSKSECILIDQSSRVLLEGCTFTVPIIEFRDISTLNANELPAQRALNPHELNEELNIPALFLHTSGSTGHPKIIPWTHRFFSQAVRRYKQDAPGFEGRLLYALGPIYHTLGALFDVVGPPVLGCPILLVRSSQPLTGESFLRYLKPFSEVIVIAIPSILEEVAQAGQGAMKFLASKTKVVFYGGAGLHPLAGDTLTANGVRVTMGYGSTELNIASKLIIPDQIPANGEWRYLSWKDGYKISMISVGFESGAKELVMEPADDAPAVLNHTNPTGFQTRDVWIEHPQKLGWWRHVGRIDDITLLSNGEKTNNKQIENILLSDPNIEHVIVFGQGKIQNGILLNPGRGMADPVSYLEQIWPSIEGLNKEIPKHSRVVRELVVVANPSRPFVKTDKGTVRAAETLALYQEDIERAYRTLEDDRPPRWTLPASYNLESIQEFLHCVLEEVLGRSIAKSDDFFEQGMDSLLAAQARAALLPFIYHSPSPTLDIPRNIIYAFPSIESLTKYLVTSLTLSSHKDQNGEREKINDTIIRYSDHFVRRVSAPAPALPDGLFVAVTGTTGSVGSFLLAQLLKHPLVQMVYCLNRPSYKPSVQRQDDSFKERGLDSRLLEENGNRVKFVDVDLSDRHLGLSSTVYDELRANITHIIHSAWQLNFNMVLQSFEKVHVAGVRHLIDLALSSPRDICPRLTFLSSVAAVSRYCEAEKVPEVPLADLSLPKTGYGFSKFVAERIVANAVEAAGLNGTVIRIGQISGGTVGTGAWNPLEHIPILLKSSAEIKMLPDDLPDPRWIPADVTARAILSLSFHDSAQALEYYHVDNPDVTPWRDISEALAARMDDKIRPVSMKDWLEEVRTRSQGSNLETDKVPAARLLNFFEDEISAPALDVSKSLTVAPELRFGSIERPLIEKYLEYIGL